MSLSFEYEVDLDGFFNSVIARSQDKINEAVNNAVTDLFVELKKDLNSVYKETIDAFYNDYSGGNDGLLYDRQGSLYELISFSDDKDIVKWDFDPSKATQLERDYGTVYSLAFLHGWHGGATGEDQNGMTVSTPHWRTPYPSNTINQRTGEPSVGYFRYGKQAARSTPPYEAWENARNEYVRTYAHDKFVSLLQEHINKIQWF